MQTKFIIVGVLAVVILGGGFMALTGAKGDKMGVVMDSAMNPLLAGMKCPYDDKDLCKFMMEWKDSNEYSMQMTMNAKGQKPTDSLFEKDGENTRMISKEGDKEIMAMVTIGEVDYMKDLEDGKWWKVTREKTKDTVLADIKTEMDFSIKENDTATETMEYKKIGKEACGKLKCFKYQMVDLTTKNPESNEFIYFDDKDYRLHKTRSESTGADGSVTEMVMLYGNVDIQVPTPVKEGSMFEASAKASGMTDAEVKEFEKMMKDAQNMPVGTE